MAQDYYKTIEVKEHTQLEHTRSVADTGWFGGGDAMSICNPMLHRTILCKSITFAYVGLRGNKSKLGLEEAWVIKLVKL